MQLIDEPRALFGLSLDTCSDSPQDGKRRRFSERFTRSFDDGITSHGVAFRGVTLSLRRMSMMIIFVPLRLADGNGHRQMHERAQERLEIGGILPSSINPQMDAGFRMPLM